MKRIFLLIITVLCLLMASCSVADPDGLVQIPSGGEENKPADGEENQPSGGEENQPSGGEENQPADGEESQPSGGEETKPSGGEENKPTGGEETKPSGGEETKPSGGEETKPSGGEETKPSGGEETKPSGGEENQPADGEVEGGEEDTPTAPERPLVLLSVTSPIKRGNKATVEICGAPGAEYDIVVCYSSGVSTAAGLENKIADDEGYVSWTWRIGNSTKPGTYTIRVVGGDEELEIGFTVAEEDASSDAAGSKPSDSEETKPSDGEEAKPSVPEQKPVLLSVTSPVKRGNKATVEVKGKPGVEYDIIVRYSSSVSSAAGLENKTADADGFVSWTWRIGNSTKPGIYTVRVIGDGEELEIILTVTE